MKDTNNVVDNQEVAEEVVDTEEKKGNKAMDILKFMWNGTKKVAKYTVPVVIVGGSLAGLVLKLVGGKMYIDVPGRECIDEAAVDANFKEVPEMEE